MPRQGCIDNRWWTSLLTMTAALPASASARYLSSLGSRHSRTAAGRSIRSAATTMRSRMRWRCSMETYRSNFLRKRTSRYSSSTSCESRSRLGSFTARKRVVPGDCQLSGQRRRASKHRRLRSSPLLGSPRPQLGVDLRVCQALGACFAFGLGDRLFDEVASTATLDQATQVTPCSSPARGVLECARRIAINRDGDVDCGAHADLLDCCQSLYGSYSASVERAPLRGKRIRIASWTLPCFRGVSMKVSIGSRRDALKDWSERRVLNSGPLAPHGSSAEMPSTPMRPNVTCDTDFTRLGSFNRLRRLALYFRRVVQKWYRKLGLGHLPQTAYAAACSCSDSHPLQARSEGRLYRFRIA